MIFINAQKESGFTKCETAFFYTFINPSEDARIKRINMGVMYLIITENIALKRNLLPQSSISSIMVLGLRKYPTNMDVKSATMGIRMLLLA